MTSEQEVKELKAVIKLLKEENNLRKKRQENSDKIIELQREQIGLLKNLIAQLQKK